jgi:hypothetical protein
MNSTRVLTFLLVMNLSSGCADATTTLKAGGIWGSDQASLTITGDTAKLQILASGGCVGSYGEIDQRIPSGNFSLPGTYTQLIGAYPGKLQYAAQFSGDMLDRAMSITITVPSLQQSVGPFNLKAGVSRTWSACLYP